MLIGEVEVSDTCRSHQPLACRAGQEIDRCHSNVNINETQCLRSVDDEWNSGRASHVRQLFEVISETASDRDSAYRHTCGVDVDLRFDVFEGEPHYHYIRKASGGEVISNHIIPFDLAAHGDMFEWVLRCLRERLPAMLSEVAAEGLVRGLDPDRLTQAVNEAEALARSARENLQKVRQAISESAQG